MHVHERDFQALGTCLQNFFPGVCCFFCQGVDHSLSVPPCDCIQKIILVRSFSSGVPWSSGGGRTLRKMDSGIWSKQNGVPSINALLGQSVPLLSWCVHLAIGSKVPSLFRGWSYGICIASKIVIISVRLLGGWRFLISRYFRKIPDAFSSLRTCTNCGHIGWCL